MAVAVIPDKIIELGAGEASRAQALGITYKLFSFFLKQGCIAQMRSGRRSAIGNVTERAASQSGKNKPYFHR